MVINEKGERREKSKHSVGGKWDVWKNQAGNCTTVTVSRLQG